MTRLIHRDDGMTLVEVIVAVVLLGVVSAIAQTMVVGTYRASRYSDSDFQGLSDARVALDRLTKELRQAETVYTGSDASHVQFWVDLNRDGAADPGELITYRAAPVTSATGVASVELRRSVTGTTGYTVLARALTSSTIFTYDTPPPGTALVTVTLTAGLNTKDAAQPRTITTQIRLRNR